MNNLLKFRFRVFALVALLVVSVTGAFAQQKVTIAIVDAGSSGSRLFVYEVDKPNSTIKCISSKDLGIPLSNIKDQSIANRFIENIANHQTNANQVPLYILATAGMRQCNEANIVYGLLGAVTSSSFGKYSLQKAMTISGRSEGLYAWIAENYTKNKLTANAKATTPQSLLSTRTNGILEIGGASLQITFVPKTNNNITDTIQHPVYGVIYSKSFLPGGVNNYQADSRNNVSTGMGIAKSFYNTSDSLLVRGGMPTAYVENQSVSNPKIQAQLVSNPKFRYVETVLNTARPNDQYRYNASKASWTIGAAYDIVINSRGPEMWNNN